MLVVAACSIGLVGIEDAPAAVTVAGLPCVSGDAYRVHVLYVRPPSSPDRLAIFKPMFDATVRRMDNVLNASAAKTGRTQHVRWVTDPPLADGSCRPSITPVVLNSDGDASSFNALVSGIRAKGHNRSDRKYFVFADAVVGEASLISNGPIQDTSASATPGVNRNNGHLDVPGLVAMADVRSFFGGWGQPHELMHTLGAVLNGAPHASGGHVTDGSDVMSGPGTICAAPQVYRYDCGNDDYYSAADPPANTWLAGHWNTANSAFLTPRGDPPAAPANDSFADAQTLTGLKGAVFSASNVGAGTQTGDPSFQFVTHYIGNTPQYATHTPRRTVWYRWAAPATARVGFYTYDQSHTDFYSAIAVFEDTNGTLGGLVFKAGHARLTDAPSFAAKAVFQAEAGKTYRIYIDGTDATSGFGNITFRWGPTAVDPDFDGDGRTDVSVFRRSAGVWFVRNSATGTTTGHAWGTNGDAPVPADYDGDGKTDVAVFRSSNGYWYVQNSATGTGTFVPWGTWGDVPVPADYDGDGKADIAVFRPSNGYWFIRNSADSTSTIVAWGTNGDIPVPGDWNNDSKADIAVFRPTTSTWFQREVAYPAATAFGTTGDIPVPMVHSFSETQMAVFRPSNGFWYTWTGAGTYFDQWGTNGDVPVATEWHGLGTARQTVFRPSNGYWYLREGGQVVAFGTSGDVPLGLPWAISQRFFFPSS